MSRSVIDAVRRISHVRIDNQGNRPAGVGKRLRKVQLQLCPGYWNVENCDWIGDGPCGIFHREDSTRCSSCLGKSDSGRSARGSSTNSPGAGLADCSDRLRASF